MSFVFDITASSWLALALLLCVTALARWRCASWFAPAPFVGLLWSFYIASSLAVVDYPVPGSGLWMLVLLVVSLQLGALIAHELQPRSAAIPDPNSTDFFDRLIVPCRRYGLICTAIALAGCVYFLFSSLAEFGLDLTWLSVLEVGARWTFLRYGDVVEPWSVRLLVMWSHPAALLGGILFVCSPKRLDRLAALATLLPSIFYGILTGARAAILLGLTCWIGGYAATLCVRSRDPLPMFSAKRLAVMVVASASMVGMFASIEGIRDVGWLQDFVVSVEGQKLSNYIFGSPAAFADWYAHAEPSDMEWGARTFAGEFDLLHLKTRISGRYLETSNVVGTESTNVYTLFRGLIEDFTPVGAVIALVCIGGMAARAYHHRQRAPLGTIFWLSAFYALFLYSPVVSIFSFNGAALAWAVLWFVFLNSRSAPVLHVLRPQEASGD